LAATYHAGAELSVANRSEAKGYEHFSAQVVTALKRTD